MTQEEFEIRISKILDQQYKYNCKIRMHLIDKDHLDCVWYGGEVGSIELPDGWKIVIGAYGDVRIYGRYQGEDIEVKDKSNYGRAYEDLAWTYNIDDETLYRLIEGYPDSFKGDEDNYLTFENNNWFEVDLITPDGQWYDLCGADNVLSNNLLECFENIEDYFEYIDWAKQEIK